MAKIIEFYIPQRFQKKVKWAPETERGKVLEFRLNTTRSLSEDSALVVKHEPFDQSSNYGRQVSLLTVEISNTNCLKEMK